MPTPLNTILSQFLQKSTVGGIGGMSLPLSLGIVATDISHTEAGCRSRDVIACRLVANNLPQYEAGE